MKVLVIGAGAWGTALAAHACRNPALDVTLCARDAAQLASLRSQRENRRYLPGVPLPAALHLALDVQALERATYAQPALVIIATPMAGLRAQLSAWHGMATPVAWLCKGFEAPVAGANARLGHEVCAEVAPGLRCGVVSGPSFAQEVARAQPTALVACSADAELRAQLVQALHSPTLRVYASDDLVGVEVGGAVKNVLAIATGLCDGLGLGLNARAALVTRGLAEITRLGVALGARAETFMGLSGLGDLVLTATGDLSRNRQVGLLLAQGRSLAQAVESLGHVAEGVTSAGHVLQRARSAGIAMPITEAVVALLQGHLTPVAAISQLMGREPKPEQA